MQRELQVFNRIKFLFTALFLIGTFTVSAKIKIGTRRKSTTDGPNVTISSNLFGVVMSNGIVSVTINRGSATITNLTYKGINSAEKSISYGLG